MSDLNPTGARGGLPLFNLARGAKGAALLLFLLPWVTVSCAGQDLVSMSGVDLATGTVTLRNPLTGATETPPGAGPGRDVVVIAAALLILASLALTFLLRRSQAALVAMAGSAAAAALLCYTVFIRLPGEMRNSPLAPGGQSGGAEAMGMNAQQMAELVRINIELGFWLTLGALAAAIVLNFMARTRAGP